MTWRQRQHWALNGKQIIGTRATALLSASQNFSHKMREPRHIGQMGSHYCRNLFLLYTFSFTKSSLLTRGSLQLYEQGTMITDYLDFIFKVCSLIVRLSNLQTRQCSTYLQHVNFQNLSQHITHISYLKDNILFIQEPNINGQDPGIQIQDALNTTFQFQCSNSFMKF